jgi:hypothetical protein
MTSGESGSTIDRKSDKPAAHVNLSSAQLMFQAGKSTDEELGQQPQSASYRGAPSSTIAANPILSTEFASATHQQKMVLQSSDIEVT